MWHATSSDMDWQLARQSSVSQRSGVLSTTNVHITTLSVCCTQCCCNTPTQVKYTITESTHNFTSNRLQSKCDSRPEVIVIE